MATLALTDRQKQDLLKAYSSGQNGWEGLKTGWALYRKGLVRLADIQLVDWTMWTITDKGIELAQEFVTDTKE